MKAIEQSAPSNRSGVTRKNLSGHVAFYSFVPTPLQGIALEYDTRLIEAMARAEFALGRLWEAYQSLDEEKRACVAEALRREEAEASWKLAAGRVSQGIVLLFSEEPLSALDEDEIADLEKAMGYAVAPFDGLPISRRLLANAHYLMTQSPRYEKKYPGELRRSPNWIGGSEATLTTASFVPPVEEDMGDGLAKLEAYIHEPGSDPSLIKAALAHYQFEVIHPFIDGNGRIGRMLTQLMLIEEGKLPADVLLLSAELLERAFEYYGYIETVEQHGDYEGWVSFFLSVIAGAAERSLAMIHSAAASAESLRQ